MNNEEKIYVRNLVNSGIDMRTAVEAIKSLNKPKQQEQEDCTYMFTYDGRPIN